MVKNYFKATWLGQPAAGAAMAVVTSPSQVVFLNSDSVAVSITPE